MSESSVSSAPTSTRQRRFACNVRWQFLANASQALLGGAYLIVLGRFLGPDAFGVFSAVAALVSVVGLLLEMRLQEVVARDLCHLDDGKAPGGVDDLRLLDLLVLDGLSRLLPASGLILFGAWLCGLIQLRPDHVHLLTLAAVGFVTGKAGNSVSTGLLRVLGRTDIIAGCMAGDWMLRLLVTLAAALMWRLDVALALWIALAVGACWNVTQITLAWREFGRRYGHIRWRQWSLGAALERQRSARRLLAANLGVSAFDLMAKDLDVALISGLLTADKVGIYKMAKSFVQVMWRAIDPFYLAIMPEVQKLWQQGRIDALRVLLRKTSVRLLLLAVALVLTGTALAALLGERVLGPGYSQVPMLMLAMSPWVIVCAPMIWAAPLAIAVNRPELSTAGSAIGLIVGLVSFSTLTPLFGLGGAAAAWSATLMSGFTFTAVVAVRLARRIPSSRAQ